MRKLVTLAATALTLGALSFATPAFADQSYGEGGYNQNNQYSNGQHSNGQYPNGQYGGDRHDDGQAYGGDRSRNFDRQEGNFDRWERGWKPGFGGASYGYGQPLNYWQLTHRLERQGYYGVRGLRQSRFGFGWRAFAFTGRGQPVMLRINPYTGRVLDVRYV